MEISYRGTSVKAAIIGHLFPLCITPLSGDVTKLVLMPDKLSSQEGLLETCLEGLLYMDPYREELPCLWDYFMPKPLVWWQEVPSISSLFIWPNYALLQKLDPNLLTHLFDEIPIYGVLFKLPELIIPSLKAKLGNMEIAIKRYYLHDT